MYRSVLIDRQRYLDGLEDVLRIAAEADPQVALVEGEAGVGKTALLRAFRAAHREITTLAWAGDDTESHLTHAMVEQLVEITGSWADPFTAGACLLGRVGELASAGPVLLVLDDAHLADQPSLVALNFAVRRLRHDPVLVLLSARTGTLSDLPASIVRMAADAGRRIVLPGLTAPGVQRLGEEMGIRSLSRRAAERLAAATNGNPLHLTALLNEVPSEELEQLDRPLGAPASFAQLVLSELAAASPEARKVANAAAVLGDRCGLTDLAAVTGLDPSEGLPALDELTRRRVLRVPPGSSTAVFEHPLVRAAVYADLGPSARMALHLAAAEVVDGWARLRHRIAAAHGPDSTLAGDLESWSTLAHGSGDTQNAAEALLAAHRLTPAGPEANRRLLAAVALYAAAGDARAAGAHVASVRALPISGRRLAVQARVAWLTGQLEDAVALGQQAWNRSDLDAYERDQLAAVLANIEILRDHAEDAVTWATRALADGRLDPALASHTRMRRALGLATSGRHVEALNALADLGENPAEVDKARHPELTMRGALRTWTGPQEVAQRDLAVAASLTHGDLQPFRLEASANLALSLFRTGDWDRSQSSLLETLGLAEDLQQIWMLGFLHAQCAAVPAARGDWTPAQEHVTKAREYAETTGLPAAAAFVDDAAVLLATARGDLHAVVRATERIRLTREASPQRELGIFCWPAHLVSALIELGHLDEAEAELARLVRLARPGSQRTEAMRLRLGGQLAAARHETERARVRFKQALAIGEGCVDALERALDHEAYGRFLRRRGERRAAIDQLRRARAGYQSLGADPFSRRCDRELAACGVHDLEVAAADDPLTPQERAVASLICDGRTNREAARELVLSIKTIGYHLGNVYAKLGVHSRTQLIAAMRDRAMAGPDA